MEAIKARSLIFSFFKNSRTGFGVFTDPSEVFFHGWNIIYGLVMNILDMEKEGFHPEEKYFYINRDAITADLYDPIAEELKENADFPKELREHFSMGIVQKYYPSDIPYDDISMKLLKEVTAMNCASDHPVEEYIRLYNSDCAVSLFHFRWCYFSGLHKRIDIQLAYQAS